jgi:hypothetical protein
MNTFPVIFLEGSIIIVNFAGDKGLPLNSMRKGRVINFIIGGALLCLEKYKRVRQRKKSHAIAVAQDP